MKPADLRGEFAAPALTGLRQAWTWRPLAALTPASVADLLRQASMGQARDYLLAAADVEEKDLHYRAVLQTRKLSVAGLPLVISPADDSRAAKKAAELAQAAVDAIGAGDLLVQLLDALSKGYAVGEIVWRLDGAQWLPQAVLPRPPEWFQFDRITGRQLRLVDGSFDGAELPAMKFVVHAPAVVSGLPILGGLARSALWAWVFKSYALRDWAAFAELYGQPIRLGKYDASATREDIAVLKKAVFDIGSDAAAVLPASMALEFVETGGKTASADLYEKLIGYIDHQVSKAVLGQTLTTDQGSSGSLAQATVHNEVRADLIRADARALAATLLRDLITPVVRLNLGEAAPLPHVELKVEEPEDMAALAVQLTQLGALGVRIPEAWVREKWGIPEAAADEAVLGAAMPDAAAPADAAAAQSAAHAVQPGAVADGVDVTPIDAQTQAMPEQTAPAWGE
ncbi:MAG: DUF935 family protein, partial [Burkholderiaceae bacterium]|nr:DUF935 family protein [Burkholderiaceae bacterium]